MTCIIFKDGKNKTLEYAINNKINRLNPLWVHESIQKQEPLDMKNYLNQKFRMDCNKKTLTKLFKPYILILLGAIVLCAIYLHIVSYFTFLILNMGRTSETKYYENGFYAGQFLNDK